MSKSQRGKTHSEETRRKLSLANKGNQHNKRKHHSEETKKKISIGNIGKNKGKKPSTVTRKRMSEAGRGRVFTEEHKRKIGLKSKGRKMSDELKERLRIINTGRILSEETKKKIGDAFRGKPGTRLGIKNKTLS
jgi:hypothetical protein